MTKKKAAPQTTAKTDAKAGDAALPTHDGTDTVDQAAEDGRAERMKTMTPDVQTTAAGQTATASEPKKG
jgi:hypothetical protein